MSQQQKTLYNEIKTALKDNNMSVKKPIVNSAGQPIISTATKPRAAAMIKRVSSSISGKVSGESVLNRTNIYQHAKGSSISKTFMTFRTLSKNSASPWEIPPRDPIKVLDETYQWLIQNYERILDQGLKNLQITLT